MINENRIQHSCSQNVCTIFVTVPDRSNVFKEKGVINIKNCDIFVGENYFVIYIDVKLHWLCIPKKIDVANLNQINIYYDTTNRILKLSLPCEPDGIDDEIVTENPVQNKFPLLAHWGFDQHLSLWKLKRITTSCRIFIDDCPESQELDSDYSYGFASRFKGTVQRRECDMDMICRMPEPNLFSPIHRSIVREIDELKDFDREQYKVNFLCLQVADGHVNPLDVNINWTEDISQSEQSILQSLCLKTDNTFCLDQSQSEIDCGLISILLAVSYDIRTTSNEPTCESGWTRSILTPTLYYFEPFTSVHDVVTAFLRRSLIYPLYRNYDLSRLCVEDVIAALNQSSNCIIKQLLVTKELFANSHTCRDVYNHYFIDDYIAYVNSDNYCTHSHLRILSNNLKNVLYDISKKHLRLDLAAIESEVLKELLPEDISPLNALSTNAEESTSDEREDDEEDDVTESDEYETETSSASESEENSVIEQCV